jgi:hypothetical protein
VYALTIFLSAFLLFQVQPLIGKFILPWFGGSPAVWTTCVLFFQLVLLGGYAYAYLVASHLRPRTQAVVHTLLLVAALAVLPITPGERWKPPDPSRPEQRILLLLAASVGVPYFVLSTTGPLLQAWVARARGPQAGVYRLYALSNVGSLLALLSYPFAFEPALSRTAQARMWSAAFVAFAALCAACAWWAARAAAPGAAGDDPAAAPADAPTRERISTVRRAMWVLLPAIASVLLLGGTNTLCQDVAAVPFLWVLPLALYLLTFILAFDHPRWYHRGVFGPLVGVALAAAVWVKFQTADWPPLPWQVALHAAVIFAGCMFCHGELARLRPASSPRALTSFYLSVAAGGAAGGLFVAIVAPRLFHSHVEYNLSLWACAAVGLVVVYFERGSILYRGRHPWAWVLLLVAMVPAAYLAGLPTLQPGPFRTEVYRSRNFYGSLAVFEWENFSGRPIRGLFHGRIVHGLQFLNPADRGRGLSYYSTESGLGRVLKVLQERDGSGAGGAGSRIGVVGLGAGTVCTLAGPHDLVRFYEIDNDVDRIARTYFTFLKTSPAAGVDVVLGDGRLSLEREPADVRFDLLVLDAFSGDAVPVHLLTREAFGVYQAHLARGGVIAVNISNLHLDLRPVVARAAEQLGMRAIVVEHDPPSSAAGVYASRWALLTGEPSLLDHEAFRGDSVPLAVRPGVHEWTDDDANLFEVMRWTHDERP